MINIKDKTKCCGCEACVQICPKSCISFLEDKQGFMYPHAEKDECINCGLCEKVCPVLKKHESRDAIELYAAKSKDEQLQKISSSGGVFTILASGIIQENGVVFGAGWEKKWNVEHSCVESENYLEKFRGSKYVQSRIGNAFWNAEVFLKEGREVLFSGTPCQIAALKAFLRKDYENLTTIDFICHGVPSPGVLRWYLQEEINNYARSASKNTVSSPPIRSIPKGDVLMPEGLEIEDIRFRDKREGWKKFSFVLLLAEASADGKKNSVSFSSNVTKDLFLQGFVRDLYLRPICYQCPFRGLRSGSDITLADFWGQSYMFPEFDDDKGVSAVIINTEKGKKSFESIRDKILFEAKAMEQLLACNPALQLSKAQPYESKKFWKLPQWYSFEDRVKCALYKSFVERFCLKIVKHIQK